MAFEPFGEVGEVFESEVDGDFLDADVGLSEAVLCVFDAEAVPELVWGGLEFLAEEADEVVGADVDGGGEVFEDEWVGEVAGVDEVHGDADAFIDAEVSGVADSAIGEDAGEDGEPFAEEVFEAEEEAEVGPVVADVPGARGDFHDGVEDGADFLFEVGSVGGFDDEAEAVLIEV